MVIISILHIRTNGRARCEIKSFDFKHCAFSTMPCFLKVHSILSIGNKHTYKETKASLVHRDRSSVENGSLQLTIHTYMHTYIHIRRYFWSDPWCDRTWASAPSLLLLQLWQREGVDRALSQGRRQLREGHWVRLIHRGQLHLTLGF